MRYVFDTSSLRVLGNYFPDRFPSFWAQFESALAAGEVVSVREVSNELQRQSAKEWLKEWAKRNRSFFAKLGPEETAFVAETLFRMH